MSCRRLFAAIAGACVAGTILPATQPASAEARRLSDERTLTRLANAVERAPVYQEPSAYSGTVGRLRYRTEDGPLETYLALETRVGALGRTWVHIRLPGRPNGRTGWVPRDDLGPMRVVRTFLRVDRTALRATLYRSGEQIWTSRIGVGTPSTPTPSGRFWIRTRIRGMGGGTVYGPWAFGTAAYSVLSDWPGGGVVGIHGTNEPWLIPGRPSHGCVRVPNHRISRLARLMPVGTPVRIV